MNTFNELNEVKGEFISPFNIVVTIGLIGLGISISKSFISKFTNKMLLIK